MKTIEENLETVDEIFSMMVLDTYISMKEIETGCERFVVYRRPNSLKKSFLDKDVYWINYHKLDNRIKYAVDVLSDSETYDNPNVLFLN